MNSPLAIQIAGLLMQDEHLVIDTVLDESLAVHLATVIDKALNQVAADNIEGRTYISDGLRELFSDGQS